MNKFINLINASKNKILFVFYETSSIFDFGEAVDVDPIEAQTIHSRASHWVNVRCSCKKTIPRNAPMHGSRLINVPNVFAGRRVKAIISRV